MFVRILKASACEHVFWQDREVLNQWSNCEDYRRMTVKETLQAGRVYTAVEIRQHGSNPGECRLVINTGERESSYEGVRWDSIEIFDVNPTAETGT